jgi:hypothetical protein
MNKVLLFVVSCYAFLAFNAIGASLYLENNYGAPITYTYGAIYKPKALADNSRAELGDLFFMSDELKASTMSLEQAKKQQDSEYFGDLSEYLKIIEQQVRSHKGMNAILTIEGGLFSSLKNWKVKISWEKEAK